MRRLPPIALLVLALAVPVGIGLGGGEASAGVAYASPYTFDQTFGTALRLVRVDLGFKIVEKDPAAGYLLFEYRSPESGGKATQGAIEIVDGRAGVHVAVQLPAMPQYHEQVLLDGLVKKLVAEHGDPPKKAPPPPADAGAPPADAGAPPG
ncbi:hypothetical protein SOCEGT47_010420 [Sorangium cellulosum]|jgi:hypothetical protein|uniref:Uncharacterized protein n=1 Tax=Sorangium cellulosum TaxID=56 RepID=A0A4P2PVC2_SORCE|nr:hypothetical protein [Sorangium cellulosum]AUX20570.1 hypothetical protein SOCEGT47_010420 [Sorangium cellulosum]